MTTTPAQFHRLFPGTGGALYGAASHGWMALFSRPGSSSRLPGLYLAGGSVHPGPGVPMAAMSGRLAAETLLAHLDSTSRSRRAAICWWYVDALSDDGRHGADDHRLRRQRVLALLPLRALRAAMPSPSTMCALNVALYGRRRAAGP